MPNYKPFAINLAKKVGRIMLRYFSSRVKNSYKQDHSPVTKADLDINRLVIENVKRRFPMHDVLGEEESHLSNSSDYVWVCDPIDGTIPYSHGIPVSVFSLALTHHGKPIVGVVYDPFHRKTFFAEQGKGATLNGKKIRVSPKKELEHALIGMDGWGLARYNLPPPLSCSRKQECSPPQFRIHHPYGCACRDRAI
ncbi:MAG: inositol monophosphatase family protein [Nanoarchaeota archaeon]